MNKVIGSKISYIFPILAGLTLALVLWYSQEQATIIPQYENNENNETVETNPLVSEVNLDVPFISEAPEDIWKNPWVNACEEASITMVEKFYQGKTVVGIPEAKEFMQMLFDVQDRLYGSNINSDGARTVDIINNYTSFKGVLKLNPTIEEIRNEIRNGRPVISLHHGGEMKNKNVHFLAGGSYYHMLVIKGFDDKNREFITHDDGDRKTGVDHRYDYDLFMKSLHDYVVSTHKTNGTPTVIFTSKE